MKSYGVYATIEDPTRIAELTETFIDNFATNVQQLKSEVVEAFISDHQAITIDTPSCKSQQKEALSEITENQSGDAQ